MPSRSQGEGGANCWCAQDSPPEKNRKGALSHKMARWFLHSCLPRQRKSTAMKHTGAKARSCIRSQPPSYPRKSDFQALLFEHPVGVPALLA